MLFGSSSAAQHSDRPYPMFVGVPGLKVIVPATPADMKGLLKAAIRDDDPVLCFEASKLWGTRGPVRDGDHVARLGEAEVVRAGTDVTIVTASASRQPALEAAEALAPDVSVEVVDLRSLVPLDRNTVLESVAKTGRLIAADPAHRSCSVASEIAAIVAEDGFDLLRAPIIRVTAPDVQVPFSVALERDFYPTSDRLIDATRHLLEFDRAPRG
jgi:pyruvate dehydrogenase E1 component beta subunit